MNRAKNCSNGNAISMDCFDMTCLFPTWMVLLPTSNQFRSFESHTQSFPFTCILHLWSSAGEGLDQQSLRRCEPEGRLVQAPLRKRMMGMVSTMERGNSKHQEVVFGDRHVSHCGVIGIHWDIESMNRYLISWFV